MDLDPLINFLGAHNASGRGYQSFEDVLYLWDLGSIFWETLKGSNYPVIC